MITRGLHCGKKVDTILWYDHYKKCIMGISTYRSLIDSSEHTNNTNNRNVLYKFSKNSLVGANATFFDIGDLPSLPNIRNERTTRRYGRFDIAMVWQ